VKTATSGLLLINKLPLKMRIMSTLIRFLRDESGATAIEYGLIAAGISIAIIVAVNGLGSKLNTKFSSINSSLK
jgi:pilus assembly protein Flp/PilA